MKTLMSVRGVPVRQLDAGGVQFTGGMTIDADGSPRAYAPAGSGLRGLDFLGNAGSPGKWWALACDASGEPFVQGDRDPAPGFYVSTTSLKRPGFAVGDPRREINSEEVPFIVVPVPLVRLVPGIVMGCLAEVEDLLTGRKHAAVVADAGPASHLGEGSIALAKAMRLNADPRTGGTDARRFKYTFWPGEAAQDFVLQPS